MALMVRVVLRMRQGPTVTGDAARHEVMPETFLHNGLTRWQDLLRFQQDAETNHTEQISMQVLRTTFPGKLLSRFGDITRSARSPDNAVPDYFLWAASNTRYMKHVLPVLMT